MSMSRKGNCPACKKALRNGPLYRFVGVIYHLRCLHPPLPGFSLVNEEKGTRYVPPAVPPHDGA